MPHVIYDKPPALENTTVSKNFAKHLNALHSSRRAFIQAELSERVRRGLRHKIRASGECYQQGDHVYIREMMKINGKCLELSLVKMAK